MSDDKLKLVPVLVGVGVVAVSAIIAKVENWFKSLFSEWKG